MDGIRRKIKKTEHKNIEHVKYNYFKGIEELKIFLVSLGLGNKHFLQNWIIDY